jgi:succinate dehydrogenase/fumarate reductase iron-sulfur protein
MTSDELTVKVTRYDAGKGSWLEEYKVRRRKGMTVLGALIHIHDKIDETLALDYNCMSGRCGTCGVMVNGFPVLACETVIKDGVSEIAVGPKRSQEPVRDLMSKDLATWEIRRKIVTEAPFTAGQKQPYVIPPHQLDRFYRLDSCIECGLCQSACPNLKEKGWAGPMHGVYAAKLDSHPADVLDRSGLMNRLGLPGCNTNMACQNTCPKGIPITKDALIPEKEKWVGNHDPFMKIIRIVFRT